METPAGAEQNRLSVSLEAAAELLAKDPEAAATKASEILDIYPGQPQALFLLINAVKLMGAEAGVRDLIEWMESEYPNIASIHYELGLLLGRLGMHKEAAERLHRVVALERNHPAAWRALGHELAKTGDAKAATSAYVNHLRLSLRELRLLEDTTSGSVDEIKAERMLRQSLDINPTDVFTTRLLGEFYLRLGKLREAEKALKRAVELAPACAITRDLYCVALSQLMDWKGANAQFQILLDEDPDNLRLQSLLAANLIVLGERDDAMALFESLRGKGSNDRLFWLNYGHAARAMGKDDKTIIEAYRKCIELDPSYGTAWWALADMKTYHFSMAEIEQMREQLERDDIPSGLRCHLEFALATALESKAAYAESFEHYRQANALRRPYISYSADTNHREMKQLKTFFTPAFFSERAGSGCPDPDPIFIVGMPRAGSTLIEQILSSHSQIEGTMELPDLGNIVQELIRQHAPAKTFPGLLSDLDHAELRRLGEEYLNRTRYQRKLGRPFFTDKAGNNFLYIGLIHTILPNAKIIDARRHPLACGFSCYKQAFAPGALNLAYDETEIGRYYRDYVEMMAHYDAVLPGRVHRVVHENLVEDPDTEIRRLIAYCGLPFEEQCLRSHETDRVVHTSSSQQVRQPIQKKRVEIWQHYGEFLQPMKAALGDVLTLYPEVPAFN
ncbi:MAG: tetratricopeptide repeat-containing sulfotransferase family protein [Alphaproteobacteria bacterium]|jgi:tetratricopeptide (TPR) repeat protein